MDMDYNSLLLTKNNRLKTYFDISISQNRAVKTQGRIAETYTIFFQNICLGP